MLNWSQLCNFLEVISVYFALQLVRCVLFSYVLTALVMLLRGTLFRRLTFAKGMLWALFWPVLFMGRMKLFYENALAVRATWWLTDGMMAHAWTAHLYMAGVTFSLLVMAAKRARLRKAVSRMEKRKINGRTVRVTDMKITPFTVGLLRSQIVLPKVMAERCGADELETVLRHERTHIRLGHLWCYLAWDILRCLLWLNPLLTLCQRYFRADMEDMCDRVCIANGAGTAREYGRLLIKTLKLLNSEQDGIASAATYAGEKDFADMKRRMEKIAGFRSYRKTLCRVMAAAAAVVLCIACMGIGRISYARCSGMEGILVYEYNPERDTTVMLDDSDRLAQMISYDEDYVYVDRAAFEAYLEENGMGKEVYIVFGGCQKLPGIGGGGEVCLYQTGADEKTAVIPYEKNKDWMMALFKVL